MANSGATSTPPQSSYFHSSPTFAPTVDKEEYTCVKCRDMLRPPVRQTACGHRLCKICLDEILQSGHTMCPGQDGEDEECVDLAIKDNVQPDFGTERDLKKLPVLCEFAEYGCQEKTPWSKLSKHVEQCQFRPVSCPNADCNVKGPKAFIEEHLKTCEFTRRRCDICRADFPAKQFDAHQRECMKTPQFCALASEDNMGCNFKGDAKALKEHNKKPEQMAEHINILNDRLRKIEFERSSILEELRAAKDAIGQGGASADTTKVQHTLMKNQAKINEKCLLTERKVEETNDVVNQQTHKLTQLQDVSKMHESRITQIEQRGGGGGAGSDDERSKIRSIESTVGMHDIRLAEYDLQFQCLESAGYEGVLIWKIKDYTRRKNDAISGRTLSLYSQPFYSSRFGYKMCARAYLNGDGEGKGTHLSLFFVIMKGDYDALLQWPFRQKVSLTLLDVEGGRKPLTDTFRPDPTSICFRYPVEDMNIASGWPLFVAQSTVETRTYMKDDTIFIKVSIDTTDIFFP